MQKTILFISAILLTMSLQAADTLFVRESRTPVMIDRYDNVLFRLKIIANSSKVLNRLVIETTDKEAAGNIQCLKLYYGGTENSNRIKTDRFQPYEYLSRNATPKRNLEIANVYSLLKATSKKKSPVAILECNQPLVEGVNYFWVSLQMKKSTPIDTKISFNVTEAIIDSSKATMQIVSPKNIEHRMGIGVRYGGDDNVVAYRIPGIVTATDGTLLSVYDIRHQSSVDLQGHIDIGLNRSKDKGQTWKKMQTILSFDTTDGYPRFQNGVGDPAILTDPQTGTIWVAALWLQGMGNEMAWWGSKPGLEKGVTGQFILTKSTDFGKTWSAPINITNQIKDPTWNLLLQGPGKGITTSDGTLVFPMQYKDENGVPHAGIIYSKDKGVNWSISCGARSKTTEAQIIELEPGVLMLNMRDDRGGSRAVATTNDWGKTWTEHSSSRSALPESVCMASLIKVPAQENILGKDILFFSNPNTTKGRHSITIKASLDGGKTWNPQHQVLLDEGEGWGYSCLTMIDRQRIGIIYEGSTAHMIFQSIDIKDIIKQ